MTAQPTTTTCRQYVAYGGLSLMVEVNSIFLHTRQLFIISGEPKSSLRYRTNALLNIFTFLTFRILLLGWMTRWLTVNRDRIPLIIFTIGSVGLAVIVSILMSFFFHLCPLPCISLTRLNKHIFRSS